MGTRRLEANGGFIITMSIILILVHCGLQFGDR